MIWSSPASTKNQQYDKEIRCLLLYSAIIDILLGLLCMTNFVSGGNSFSFLGGGGARELGHTARRCHLFLFNHHALPAVLFFLFFCRLSTTTSFTPHYSGSFSSAGRVRYSMSRSTAVTLASGVGGDSFDDTLIPSNWKHGVP